MSEVEHRRNHMSSIEYDSDLDKSQSVVVRVERDGDGYYILVHNRGHNVVEVSRLLVCETRADQSRSQFPLYPPPSGQSWEPESAVLLPGAGPVFFRKGGVAAGTTVEPQAEFIEFAGRSRSSTFTV